MYSVVDKAKKKKNRSSQQPSSEANVIVCGASLLVYMFRCLCICSVAKITRAG